MLTEDQLKELAEMQALDIGGGYTLHFRAEPDEDTSINDFDCYGKVEWTRNNRYNGCSVRPETFTGRARKIESNYNHTLWWEPPVFDAEDARRYHTDPTYRNALFDTAVEIVRHGFVTLVVELCKGTDAYGRPIVEDVGSLGGVEPDEDYWSYLADIIHDLRLPLSR